jgi:photosystem II stability/assembly factor-like uncharacterized protein
MQRKIDETINRHAKHKKSTKPLGGKALQRLFVYLGERDPRLVSELLARLTFPKHVRPQFGSGAKRARRAPAAVKSFAAAIVRAGAARTASSRKLGTGIRTARTAAGTPAAPASIWQFIGPSVIPNGQTYGKNRVNLSGRVSCIAVDPKNPKHLLVGAAAGGIWESKDTGATWNPRTDQMPSLAIGAVAFDPRDPKNVYAGSGEGNSYSNLGAGIYQSTDGGTNWSVLTEAPFLGIGFYDLVVDPTDSAVLYAATTDGFFVSTTGGSSWTRKRAEKTNLKCWDISLHPAGGATAEILAAFSDGLFVSTSGGDGFTAVNLPSAPADNWVRLAVDRVRTTPDIAYVFGVIATTPHLWRRAGGTWTKINSLPPVDEKHPWTSQADYDWYVAATPDNERQVYLGAIDTLRGNLSGSTWKWVNITTRGSNSIHPDQHCLTFSSDNSKTIYAGNDGGIFRSTNSATKWKALNKGLGITEIEYLASDPSTWKWLMAGTQDNGTIRFTGSSSWDQIADGDGGHCGVNPLNPRELYHSFYYDEKTRLLDFQSSTDKGNTWTDLVLPEMSAIFYPPVEVFGATVAVGATSLIISRNKGSDWTTVPLGLSAREASTAMREIDANTILIGTNFGSMLRLSWTGSNWTKLQLTSPARRYISCIAVDPSNPQRFWVTLSEIGDGSVYRSDNAGSSWANCTPGLPSKARPLPMNAVVVDPADFKRVWVAADVGVYQTLDLGSNWTGFSNGLPNAMAVDLLLHKQDRMLICATRNRGVWVMPIT